MYQRGLGSRRLVVTCEGYRIESDGALRRTGPRAGGGQCAPTASPVPPSLNSYERRVVHVALDAEPGIRTFSVGEEGNRPGDGGAPAAPTGSPEEPSAGR